MSRTGGGSNHLAYLSALLALHRFAAQNDRPIPRFLFIDQPTQVYFPSEQVYNSADGTVQKTESDADLDAVRRLFELLVQFTQVDVPGFQLIVTEHANLREQWFQDARRRTVDKIACAGSRGLAVRKGELIHQTPVQLDTLGAADGLSCSPPPRSQRHIDARF